jgi:ParB family chromosome partitioning protein
MGLKYNPPSPPFIKGGGGGIRRIIEMKTIQKIPLNRIDLSDETFSINFMPDLQRLRSSIAEIGLIQPVLLREKREGYQILCGFRRISVFHELKKVEIDSRVFGEKEMDDLQFFSLSLHENLSTRGFNTVEKAIALDKLIHCFQADPNFVIQTYLPLFSLEPHEKILNTYLSLVQMEDEVKRYVLNEEVSRSNIRKLSAMSPEDRMALLSLLSSLKLGENRLREVLNLLNEISRREGLMMKEIVQQKDLQKILSQKDLTPSQRTESVKKVLMDLRYPRMRKKEEAFEKKRKELNMPLNISLRHAPHFEGKELRVEFQFETMEEYRSIISSLSQLPDKKEFEEMIQK